MKKRCVRPALLFVLVLFFLLPSTAFAWWNTAHEIIVEMAEKQLSATAKANVQILLSVDVAYPGNLELSRRSDTLVTCAPWADTIKKETDWHTSEQKNFFSALHFIDIPIPQDAVPSKEASEQRFWETIHNNPVENVDYAIKSAMKVLASAEGDPVHSAIALRFFIHFVGDIHCPLHASDPILDGKTTDGGNLVILNSPTYFPAEKGNYSVEINGAQYNETPELHQFWDAMGGAFKQLSDPTYVSISSEDLAYLALAASELDRKYAGDFESEIGNPNVDDWAIESNYYASIAYTTNTMVPRFVNCENNSCLNNNLPYEQDTAATSEIRIYLAGKRLANFLNTLFDPEVAVPSYAQYIQEILENPSVYDIYKF